MLGLAKKVLIANPLGAVADAVFGVAAARAVAARRVARRGLLRASRSTSTSPATRTWRSAWGACSASGFRENFDHPYLSRAHHAILAALAHLAVDLVARLPLHPARRQPARAVRTLREPDDRVPADRALARRRLDLRALGRLPRPLPQPGPVVLGTRRRAPATLRHHPGQLPSPQHRVGLLPRRGSRERRRLPGAPRGSGRTGRTATRPC